MLQHRKEQHSNVSDETTHTAARKPMWGVLRWKYLWMFMYRLIRHLSKIYKAVLFMCGVFLWSYLAFTGTTYY